MLRPVVGGLVLKLADSDPATLAFRAKVLAVGAYSYCSPYTLALFVYLAAKSEGRGA